MPIKPYIITCFRQIYRLAFTLIGLPMLYLIEPFFKFRFGTMYTQRIGHLAENAEVFIRRMQVHGMPKRTLYIFFGLNPSNRQLFEMWLRTDAYPVRFIESKIGTWLAFSIRPILSRTRFWERYQDTHIDYRVYDQTEPVLSFTPEEEEKGRQELLKMGIGEDDWFVAFHARDNQYLETWRPDQKALWNERFQLARNVDVHSMLKAATHIAESGGFAIRVGAVVEKPLPSGMNPRIIDYATTYRSDFMDIYIAAKCRFFISSLSGIDSVASIFNVPLVSTNHSPYNFSRYNRASVLVPRLLANPRSGVPVPYWEAQANGYFVGWDRVHSNHPTWGLYEQLPSTDDDILDGVKDILDILDGRQPPEQAREIQDIYGKLYLSHKPDHECAGKIGARFALKYRELIVPNEMHDRSIGTNSAKA
ncbi:TIGR04372 family glycosyltransferase [Thalassospiraceae bacterium LMO-JJ14]|nr:TIGR04372 family glycosyltransferase [Thalassospiraceae bacterium LMO-JJ14]